MARNPSKSTPKVNNRRGSGSEKEQPQPSGNSSPQGEVERDRQQEDERKRVSGKAGPDHSALTDAQPDDHSAMPSPGDVGAPEYYAKASPPKVAHPGRARYGGLEEQGQEGEDPSSPGAAEDGSSR